MVWKFPTLYPGETVLFLENPAQDVDDARPMEIVNISGDVLEGIARNRDGNGQWRVRVTHILDPRVQDPNYVHSIQQEGDSGFFIENPNMATLKRRVELLETALGKLASGKKADAAKILADLQDGGEETEEQPGVEIAGPVVLMSERLGKAKPLSDEEKAAKLAALQSAVV